MEKHGQDPRLHTTADTTRQSLGQSLAMRFHFRVLPRSSAFFRVLPWLK